MQDDQVSAPVLGAFCRYGHWHSCRGDAFACGVGPYDWRREELVGADRT